MNDISSDTSPKGPEAIELQMPTRRPDEDWSGITDRAEPGKFAEIRSKQSPGALKQINQTIADQS
ncbi:unnamed protein product [Penicillium pancosmium]